MSRFRFLFAGFVAFCVAGLAHAAPPQTFTQAKKVSRQQVYQDARAMSQGTIYCGCDWQWYSKNGSGGQVDQASCGYQTRKNEVRANRIEWEHVMPAWVFGHQRQCWQKGGRKNCNATDAIFNAMESDLHNLDVAIGEVNADRSNYSFGMVTGVSKQYGACPSKTDFKARRFEPRDEAKGRVARIYFYMADRYKLRLSRQEQQLLMAWDRMYPVSGWERERDRRIAKVMGWHNPYVTGEKQWARR
ncbi:deoxyribonuclease I [Sinimarinibacterium sp. NLF-5-8]|nr:endonuclease [Sinimarinibacterium sp. NLF-5-8]QHS09101.1 deoxyribonuclease I [Sinimarinibacterium sp. NLF-5-8]